MTLLMIIFVILGSVYCAIILYFFTGIYRVSQSGPGNSLSVSVLVPARNEAQNILACLQSLWEQTYPRDLYQVYVIDDHSTDQTAEVVRRFISDKPNFHLLIHRSSQETPTFKKQALKYALSRVTSEIILTIDADTRAQPGWIEKITGMYQEDTGLVAGLVTFSAEGEKGLFHKMQTLEFAGIVFCGVGAAGNNNPIICNGSNLSYRLRAFHDAGGYDGTEFLPSGDDDLLLQSIRQKTEWKIKYCLHPETVNFTRPVDTWPDFLNQRSRWASKSIHYPQRSLLLVMALIYLYYLSLVVLLPMTIWGIFPWKIYLTGLLLKMIPEALIISKGLDILRRPDLSRYFLVAQVFQIGYVLLAGIRGLLKRFNWKGKTSVGV